MNSSTFAHFKVGIGKDNSKDTKDYVLGKFSKNDQEKINKVIPYSNQIIDDFLDLDIEKVMSRYNGEAHEIK